MMKDSSATAIFEQASKLKRLQREVEKVIRGKPETIKFAIVTLLARGNLLIEDVPGIGKTTLSNALAKALNLSFQRIQFTSDLLPSDITGLSVYNQKSDRFEFKPGPVFANIVLADEINRATPKTQSALLEAMAEGQVTVDGVSRRLPEPFMVIATQNPTEHHGTYPLPESQLDRFMLRLHIGYPSRNEERQILLDRQTANPLDYVEPVMEREEILFLQNLVMKVRMDDDLIEYLLQIVEQTRRSEFIELGISPRGSLALFRSAQALALVEGRDFCIADDIKRLVIPCFAHRLILSGRFTGAVHKAYEAERILAEIISKVKVPV
ncbi:MAG: MoxR family ATPase [Acidobacteriota bacterium]|nr:MoxR family ATPase [Acidobacteriota bacterium]